MKSTRALVRLWMPSPRIELMKEWVVVLARETAWIELAKETQRFVRDKA